MTHAKVNGVDCIIYDFMKVDGFTICRVKYPNYDVLLPVLAELIEVSA